MDQTERAIDPDKIPGEKFPKGSPLRRRSADYDRLVASYAGIYRAAELERRRSRCGNGAKLRKIEARARAILVSVPPGSQPWRKHALKTFFDVMRFANDEARRLVEAEFAPRAERAA